MLMRPTASTSDFTTADWSDYELVLFRITDLLHRFQSGMHTPLRWLLAAASTAGATHQVRSSNFLALAQGLKALAAQALANKNSNLMRSLSQRRWRRSSEYSTMARLYAPR
jgi:hypothetical protein